MPSARGSSHELANLRSNGADGPRDMRDDTDTTATPESPESRLYAAPPPRKGSADWFRDDMLRILGAPDTTREPVAAKSVDLPVQVASFEC